MTLISDSDCQHYPMGKIEQPSAPITDGILITHPGKIGDLIWAAATMKAVADKFNCRVDIATSPYCAGLIPLLLAQEWVRTAVVLPEWNVTFSAPVAPVIPPPYFNVDGSPLSLEPKTGSKWDRVFHFGMREWPGPTLFEYYPNLLKREYGIRVTLDPNCSWFSARSNPGPAKYTTICWSDEWKELKAGLTNAIVRAHMEREFQLLPSPTSQFFKLFRFPFRNVLIQECDLLEMAEWIHNSTGLITCNSSPHPLANALGQRTFVVEPSTPRHQEVFKHRISRNTYVDDFNAEVVLERLEKWLNGQQ